MSEERGVVPVANEGCNCSQREQLRQQVESLQQSVGFLRRANGKFLVANVALGSRVYGLAAENRELRQQVEKLSAAYRGAESELKDAEVYCADLKVRYQEAVYVIGTLGLQLISGREPLTR